MTSLVGLMRRPLDLLPDNHPSNCWIITHLNVGSDERTDRWEDDCCSGYSCRRYQTSINITANRLGNNEVTFSFTNKQVCSPRPHALNPFRGRAQQRAAIPSSIWLSPLVWRHVTAAGGRQKPLSSPTSASKIRLLWLQGTEAAKHWRMDSGRGRAAESWGAGLK